ncbi:hypothetical protein NS319_05625 [Sphingomonas sanguinis]|uniref:Uncharacterized protein n=2 Tax=Sphingomonas TaxID=13687 RepID=A0A147I217_9SPHN|nr:hypothetical protein NS319_05625 [Sphingomonas sanguinis]KTW09255.1 hypothetical protein NS258_15805 [Sphingomonas sanguinis]
MMGRRVLLGLALLLAWATYGLVMLPLADQEATRCHQFGDLAAECSAPFMLFYGIVTVIFLMATITLAILAVRCVSRPGR